MAGIGITAIAGCISQADTGDQPPNEATNTPTDQPPTNDPTETTQMNEHERIPTGETTNIALGEETLSETGARTPHGIVLDNPTDETWTRHLVIREPDDSVALDETYELESESNVAVSLTDPLRYTAEVNIPETESSSTVDVDLAWFDCNASSTSFTIQSDGEVKTATISTKMACLNVTTERVSAGKETSLSLGDGSLSNESDSKPHGMTLTNPTEDTVTSRLVIARGEEVLLDGLYTLESVGEVAVTLTEPGHYQGTASIPTTGTTETFEVKPNQFDCNHSSTNISIRSDSELDAETISTLMACQPSEDGENETSDQ